MELIFLNVKSKSINLVSAIRFTSGHFHFPVTSGVITNLVVTAIMGLFTTGLTENNAYTIDGI